VTVLPVIERELRAEARHVFTYWLRALGASVSMIIFAAMMIDAPDNTPGLGAKLFGNLNTALFIAIPYVPGWQEQSLGEFIVVLCTGFQGMWSEAIKFLPIAATRAWLAVVAEIAGVSLLIFGLAIIWVACRVESSRQERPATTRQLRWQNYFFAPRFWKSLFRSKMRRTLERNPIGWLQQYSTAARMIRWGWCLFLVMVECLLVRSGNWYELEWPQYWLLLLLALSLAASAAGSFRRERETGALELILVAPLSVPQIIFGRLCGLWRQFLPALGMLLAVLAFLFQTKLPYQWSWRWETDRERDLGIAILVVCTFAALPIVGLYYSLAKKTFLTAWLTTIAVGLAAPLVVTYIGVLLTMDTLVTVTPAGFQIFGLSFLASAILTGALQLIFASLAAFSMFRNLRYRKFALAS